MWANRFYYELKPLVPSSLRIAMRRMVARRMRRMYSAMWPIDPKASRPLENWPGWPEGKQFAFILTHDVEGPRGLGRVHELMQLEQELGFRSSFNFIPEAGYKVSREFRDSITSRGFEVGVHDLRHDGKLYRSRDAFRSHAKAINGYLKEWNATGFRSGFMHHNLDWLHDLEIQYDMSTFDTDPFEPQPHGMHTIFPFWVPNPGLNHSGNGTSQRGYVELPYTLPQDSTLFLLFRERNIDIWRTKLDWLAANRGMALLNVHPDYLSFHRERSSTKEFPAAFYRDFLAYVREHYDGRFWNALPREVASYARGSMMRNASPGAPRQLPTTVRGIRVPKRTIWVDLDNTPHVPFFLPIIRELEKRGYRVLCTARNAFQVCELAQKKGLKCMEVGHHYGKNRMAKLYGLFYRAMQLSPVVSPHRPALALSHGSRSQVIAANFLGIPTVLLTDYEFAKYPPLMRPRWEMVPEAIPAEGLYCKPERVRFYPGIKEDVYVPEFRPDRSILNELGVSESDIVVTVRPPATEAHYHNPESDVMFSQLMEFLLGDPRARIILLPRNSKQAAEIKTGNPQWFLTDRLIIPGAAVDGLNLLYHSDLVISGGGTMNREAAALGVPVYSIFRGEIGAVDRHLEKSGLLVLITGAQEIKQKIKIAPRAKSANGFTHKSPALDSIVSHIEEILSIEAVSQS
jgi:predicted glycosyltransferase